MANSALPAGKLPPELLESLLASAGTGRSGPEILLGPRAGEDACAIALGAGTLVAGTDPITMTGERVGWHAVHVNANDVAACGVRPRWFLANVLVPVGTEVAALEGIFCGMHEALRSLDATLVGGHTEVTPAVSQPVVVGQMLGYAASGRYLSTSNLTAGEHIIQVGPAPIEAAPILADLLENDAAANVPRFPDALDGCDPGILASAHGALDQPGISVVAPALLATELGASALHDPTEGGLANGLHEMANAAGVRIDIVGAAVQWFGPGLALAARLGLDPWGLLASGCLLVAVPPRRLDPLLDALRRAGHPAAAIGTARAGAGVFADGECLATFARDELSRV